MAKIYISYVRQDWTVAEELARVLAGEGISYEMSPDSDSGINVDYNNGLDTCRYMFCLYSASYNESDRSLREVERAVLKGIPIIAFRLDESIPSRTLEYFLLSNQWHNACDGDYQSHFREVINSVREYAQEPACAYYNIWENTGYSENDSNNYNTGYDRSRQEKIASKGRRTTALIVAGYVLFAILLYVTLSSFLPDSLSVKNYANNAEKHKDKQLESGQKEDSVYDSYREPIGFPIEEATTERPSYIEEDGSYKVDKKEEVTELVNSGELESLTELEVYGSDISDFSFLKECPNMEKLSISYTDIKSYSFLKCMPKLKSLYSVGNDKAYDAEKLEAAAGLTSLYLDCSGLNGMPKLSKFAKLKTLVLQHPDELTGITSLTELENLGLLLGVCELPDMRAFSNLKVLDISKCRNLKGLNGIDSLNNLKELYMANGEYYFDVTQIFSMENLNVLDISGSTLVCDLDKITGLKGLKSLDLSGVNVVKNVKQYSDGFFSAIDYDKVIINSHLSAIGSLNSLEKLTIQNNKIESLEFVKGLSNLKELDISKNYVENYKPLSDLKKLQWVNVSENASVTTGKYCGESVTVVSEKDDSLFQDYFGNDDNRAWK